MNYQTMQFQAREKQQQFRQEAQHHRFARQAKINRGEPGQSNLTGKLVATIVAATAAAAAMLVYII